MIDFNSEQCVKKTISEEEFSKLFTEKDKKFELANFSGITFECFANFSNAVFTAGADFSNAKFQKGASFENAVFKSPKKTRTDVNFNNARFGIPYDNRFGDWRIRFGFDDKNKKYKISRAPIASRERKTEKPEAIDIDSSDNLRDFIGVTLKNWGMEGYEEQILNAYLAFEKNPPNTSFRNCTFGSYVPADIQVDTQEEIAKECIANERELIKEKPLLSTDIRNKALEKLEKADEYFAKSTPESEKAKIGPFLNLLLFRHMSPEQIKKISAQAMNVTFDGATFFCKSDVDFRAIFANSGLVSLEKTLFANGGHVLFSDTPFANCGDVNFVEALFTNGGHVGFRGTRFTNCGEVNFRGTSFANGGFVGFNGPSFINGDYVGFSHTSFANGGDVNFQKASFINGGDIGFHQTSFGNGGSVIFHGALFANDRDFHFRRTKIWEDIDISFHECLFMCSGKVNFEQVTFPAKKPTMFQRCHFASRSDVVFSGIVFHQTTFEGGKIGWLESVSNVSGAVTSDGNVSLESLLENEKKEIPERLKGKLIPIFTNVFDDGVRVVWKDLAIDSAKNLLFRLVNLSGSIFDGVTLRHIEINAPKWNRNKKHKRSVLLAEIELDEEVKDEKIKEGSPDYSSRLKDIENQYTQLRNNLERTGDYVNASDFHYGEMEMRRRGMGRLRRGIPFTFTNLYRTSSGYGERPLQALKVTLLLLALLVVFSFWAHYYPLNSKLFTFIEKDDSLPSQIVKVIGHVLKPYSETLTVTEPDTNGKTLIGSAVNNENWWYYLFLYLGKMALYLQTVMFALAVKRKFKR